MALQTEVVYRYFLTDLLSNQVIAEVPFKGVSYERVNRRAGGFSGNIPFIEATKGLDLYEATMPGRTGIYIMRNNVCVWGGIIWSRSYDVTSRNLSVEGAEFTSYFYHRNIWQTLQYGSEFYGVSSYSVSNGIASVTTETPHGFTVGLKVKITYTSPLVDGTHTIASVPSANSFTFSTTSANGSGNSISGAVRSLVDNYDFIRDLIYRMQTDLGGLGFENEVIKPGIELQASVISKKRSGGVVTLTTEQPHDIIIGQEIEVLEVGSDVDGIFAVSGVPTSTTIEYILNGPDVSSTAVSGIKSYNVKSKSLVSNVATITTDRPHGAVIGQTVILEGVDAFFTGRLDTTFNGRFVITGVPTPDSFTFSSGGILDVPTETAKGGVATFGSKAIYGTYGSFTSNGDIGITYSEPFDTMLSGFYQEKKVYRGFEQKTVGEVLEEFSNTVNGGFDYRIDCDYDYDSAQFVRTLWLSSNVPGTLSSGLYYTPEELGADQLVFTYPGNIASFSIEESAEDAATRFFVVGNIEDITDDASQPYSAAIAPEYLNNPRGRSWPLLDQTEQLDKVDDEIALYNYAGDYLYESLPPIGTYSISVNGSLDPIVGSYEPGRWCIIAIDDEFVRSRIGSDQEPDDPARDGVLLRRINSYKVSVPDSPTFPETVELELITDWKVDKKSGEQTQIQ
jgi:hypothetical protein